MAHDMNVVTCKPLAWLCGCQRRGRRPPTPDARPWRLHATHSPQPLGRRAGRARRRRARAGRQGRQRHIGGDGRMRHDCEGVSDNELHELHRDTLGRHFEMRWDDDDMHRDEAIACLESGTPQKPSAIRHNLPDGALA